MTKPSSLEAFIRNVPDFPKKGIVFKDITPLLANCQALGEAVDRLAAPYAKSGVDVVVGVEARGFIFGALVAQKLKAAFVPIRKVGKLPYKTVRESYSLEYGTDSVEIHADAVAPGQKVLMVDDLLATGGTMAAACRLVKGLGGQIVGATFVVELSFLPGRKNLGDCGLVTTLIDVKSE
ncbi:MAG: adenine phosphoribosyltransferase [Phycisphaerae bacterium]|jgi:adenine phosphoribosyltransferase